MTLAPEDERKKEREMSKELTFSQRMGLAPVNVQIQTDNIDHELRTELFNWVLETVLLIRNDLNGTYSSNQVIKRLQDERLNLLWKHHYKHLLTEHNDNVWVIKEVQDDIISGPWNKVYDLLEFMIYKFNLIDLVIYEMNQILEKGLSGFRYVKTKFVSITSEQEIAAIESALDESSEIKPVNIQLKKALDKLSNRENPDYRGSIKESISAVETLSKIIAGNQNATLSKALNFIEEEKKINVHPALREAFIKLYGWTSDAEGIRHGLMGEENLGVEDAIYMLVSCSAFISYLLAKLVKVGIALDE